MNETWECDCFGQKQTETLGGRDMFVSVWAVAADPSQRDSKEMISMGTCNAVNVAALQFMYRLT